jgi:hypothetical protein
MGFSYFTNGNGSCSFRDLRMQNHDSSKSEVEQLLADIRLEAAMRDVLEDKKRTELVKERERSTDRSRLSD